MRLENIVYALAISCMGTLLFAHAGSAGTSGPQADYAPVGGETSIPYGWLDFCHREPQECDGPARAPADVNLTSATWKVMNVINKHVNHTIKPVSNYAHWGTWLDHWDYPTDGKGDCKIYALYKRKLLADAGLPRQALLMTIVRDLNGNGHAILTVKTDHGDFVLDNLRDDIRPWDATGYHFLKRQSQQNPNVWVSIGDSRALYSSSH